MRVQYENEEEEKEGIGLDLLVRGLIVGLQRLTVVLRKDNYSAIPCHTFPWVYRKGTGGSGVWWKELYNVDCDCDCDCRQTNQNLRDPII